MALHFSNTYPWSSTKEIESVVVWLILTLDFSDLLTYLVVTSQGASGKLWSRSVFIVPPKEMLSIILENMLDGTVE